jgi:hypothetical protein
MKTSGVALKAKVQYSTWDDSNWHCFYHALSGDELKTQIISIFYKPTGDERSWPFVEVSAPYKVAELEGLKKWVIDTYGAAEGDADECVEYICCFINDAREEFGTKPLIKETIDA